MFLRGICKFKSTARLGQHSYPTGTAAGETDPTVAALAFLVARTAIEDGNSVNLFLAGDAVNLIRDQVIDSLIGIGTGRLREH